MSDVAVHVGLPKSGSSSIQAFLARNRARLAARGVRYDGPMIDRWSQLEIGLAACQQAGALVPDAMLRRRLGLATLADQAGPVRRLEAALAARPPAAGERAVISSEHIGAWLTTPALRAALDGWLRARFGRVRYVLVVRPQDEFVLSSYSESLRRGSARSLEAFVAGYDELDVRAAMEAWDAEFGPRITILLLPRGADAQRRLIERFCAAAGIEASGLSVPRRRNRALSARAAAILRGLNRLLGRDLERGPVRRALFAALRRPVEAVFGFGPPLRLTEAQRAALAARYPAPVAEWVAARGGAA
jgi:hypothetical protein